MKLIKSILNFLSNLSCKSKCCSGSECICGSNPPPPECLKEDYENRKKSKKKSRAQSAG